MTTKVKICGITEEQSLKTACEAGADFIGFVFVTSSPRYIAPRAAGELSRLTPTGVKNVGLFVNPTDSELDEALSQTMLDYIQLHGDEDLTRVIEIKNRTHMPIIKGFRIGNEKDIEKAYEFETYIDYILFDHKSDQTGEYGGTGKKFDWSLLAGKSFSKPWILSGGLTAEALSEALTNLAPDGIDVSSGVERKKGIKDEEKIRKFIYEAKSKH
jgi:phosphoribosylanthranilate isomerase